MHAQSIKAHILCIPVLPAIDIAVCSSCLLTGCSGGTSSRPETNAGHSVSSRADGSGSDADSSGQKRADAMPPLVPTASGETCYGDDSVSIDASNISDGYVMIRYTGRSEKAKARSPFPTVPLYIHHQRQRLQHFSADRRQWRLHPQSL